MQFLQSKFVSKHWKFALCTPQRSRSPPVSPYQISRSRRIQNRKRRKLKSRQKSLKQVHPHSLELGNIEDKLSILAVRIRDLIEEDLSARERKAVECVKNNPSYFFSYAKEFSKLRSNIGFLKDGNGTVHHDPEKMAQLLQEQFSSVLSNPKNTELKRYYKLPSWNIIHLLIARLQRRGYH